MHAHSRDRVSSQEVEHLYQIPLELFECDIKVDPLSAERHVSLRECSGLKGKGGFKLCWVESCGKVAEESAMEASKLARGVSTSQVT